MIVARILARHLNPIPHEGKGEATGVSIDEGFLVRVDEGRCFAGYLRDAGQLSGMGRRSSDDRNLKSKCCLSISQD